MKMQGAKMRGEPTTVTTIMYWHGRLLTYPLCYQFDQCKAVRWKKFWNKLHVMMGDSIATSFLYVYC